MEKLLELPNASIWKRGLAICVILVFTFSFLFASLEVLGANPAIGDQDWAMFRHDLSHSGSSPSTGPNSNNSIWIYNTSVAVFSSASVVNDKVYIVPMDGTVYCLNADTGNQLWNYSTNDLVYWSCPTVIDDKVYVGSHLKIYCLNALTGASIWNYTTDNWVDFSAAVADGKVYMGSEDGRFYCLDAATGSQLWNYTTSSGVYSSAAVVDGKVYFGTYVGKIFCLDAVSGTSIWNYTTGNTVKSSPAVSNGKVFVGSDDSKLYCLDATTGAFIWSYTTGSRIRSSPAIADGKVYVGSDDNKLYCLDATTGAFIWSYTTINFVSSSPAIADGKVYVGSYDRKVYCLNSTTGAFIWSYATARFVSSSPAIANGKMYVGSHDGKFYCFGPPASNYSSPSPIPTITPTFTPIQSSSTPEPTINYSSSPTPRPPAIISQNPSPANSSFPTIPPPNTSPSARPSDQSTNLPTFAILGLPTWLLVGIIFAVAMSVDGTYLLVRKIKGQRKLLTKNSSTQSIEAQPKRPFGIILLAIFSSLGAAYNIFMGLGTIASDVNDLAIKSIYRVEIQKWLTANAPIDIALMSVLVIFGTIQLFMITGLLIGKRWAYYLGLCVAIVSFGVVGVETLLLIFTAPVSLAESTAAINRIFVVGNFVASCFYIGCLQQPNVKTWLKDSKPTPS